MFFCLFQVFNVLIDFHSIAFMHDFIDVFWINPDMGSPFCFIVKSFQPLKEQKIPF